MRQRFACALRSRGVVEVRGGDASRFLQGLVTSDVGALRSGGGAPRAAPAAFLNGRGRLLFGALLARAGEHRFLVDVPAARVPALLRHLAMYRLRADVDVADVSRDHAVWAVVGARRADALDAQVVGRGALFQDPRLPALGMRAIVEARFEGFDLPAADERAYTRLRILHGVPDGPDFDNMPLPLDLAFDLLHGVSFNKGCYLGQELTARSHFTGVLRKRLTPVALLPPSAETISGPVTPSIISEAKHLQLLPGTEIRTGTKKKGALVSSAIDNIGLAVLRLDDALPNNASSGRIHLPDGRVGVAWRPPWWESSEPDAGQAPDR